MGELEIWDIMLTASKDRKLWRVMIAHGSTWPIKEEMDLRNNALEHRF